MINLTKVLQVNAQNALNVNKYTASKSSPRTDNSAIVRGSLLTFLSSVLRCYSWVLRFFPERPALDGCRFQLARGDERVGVLKRESKAEELGGALLATALPVMSGPQCS